MRKSLANLPPDAEIKFGFDFAVVVSLVRPIWRCDNLVKSSRTAPARRMQANLARRNLDNLYV